MNFFSCIACFLLLIVGVQCRNKNDHQRNIDGTATKISYMQKAKELEKLIKADQKSVLGSLFMQKGSLKKMKENVEEEDPFAFLSINQETHEEGHSRDNSWTNVKSRGRTKEASRRGKLSGLRAHVHKAYGKSHGKSHGKAHGKAHGSVHTVSKHKDAHAETDTNSDYEAWDRQMNPEKYVVEDEDADEEGDTSDVSFSSGSSSQKTTSTSSSHSNDNGNEWPDWDQSSGLSWSLLKKQKEDFLAAVNFDPEKEKKAKKAARAKKAKNAAKSELQADNNSKASMTSYTDKLLAWH